MADIYGSDILFDTDFELVLTGDIEITEGIPCLVQDIKHRLLTPRGNLFYNPDYGVDIYKYINDENIFMNRMALSQDIKKEVESDPRVRTGSVSVNIEDWDLKKIQLKVTFTPVEKDNPVNILIRYNLDS